MDTWSAPANTSLSTDDISHVVADLTNPASRDDALAFLDKVTDPGLLYVIACNLGGRFDKPNVGATAEGHRNYIRNRV